MSAQPSPLGYGLYFIDVLACLLFCLTLALAGARFGRERTVEVELPELETAAGAPGANVVAPTVALRREGGAWALYWDEERVSAEALRARLRASPPPKLVVRAEASRLTEVIGAAHAAGVRDIELAYEENGGRGEAR